MRQEAAFWIKHLELSQHPEGGWYRETYRSAGWIHPRGASIPLSSTRSFSTSIYFLLEKNQCSAFHRIRSDEQWHFYEGDPLRIYEILQDGLIREHLLGDDPEKGCVFQTTIAAGNWFASRVEPGGLFSLAGCTVAPGFDFADFEMAERAALTENFPQHKELIKVLTPQAPGNNHR